MKKYLIISVFFAFGLFSCKKEKSAGGTSVQMLSGEWWVRVDGAGEYVKISTYNTAENLPTSMWLNLTKFKTEEEHETVFGKVNVDVNSKTFSGTDIKNAGTYSDPKLTFTIKNGKVITDGIVAPVSKAVTDSIYLEVEFSDKPKIVYKLGGYHRTKFKEDEH